MVVFGGGTMKFILFIWLLMVSEATKNMFNDYWKYEKYDILVPIKGGSFLMGNKNSSDSSVGEYPQKKMIVSDFSIDKFPVTNAQFWRYHQLMKSKVKTQAQKSGFSYLFVTTVTKNHTVVDNKTINGEPWWIPVKGVKWSRPEGPKSDTANRMHYPTVHVSYFDAVSYCEWQGKRLPTEVEWEFAARGGLRNRPYPWGDGFKANRTNLWQGLFPYENKASDGYRYISPVDAYPPQNDYGLYDMLGNVWEWTSTPAREQNRNKSRSYIKQHILKGASFIDFREDKSHINHAARISNRLARPQTFTSQNVGFRCAKTQQYEGKFIRNPNRVRDETTPRNPSKYIIERREEL